MSASGKFVWTLPRIESYIGDHRSNPIDAAVAKIPISIFENCFTNSKNISFFYSLTDPLQISQFFIDHLKFLLVCEIDKILENIPDSLHVEYVPLI